MAEPSAAPPMNFETVETESGVRYRFPRGAGGGFPAFFLVALVVVAAAPLVLGAAATVYLVRVAAAVEPVWLALSGLFVGQMVYVAALAVYLFRGVWPMALGTWFGRNEIELTGEWLTLGYRVGPWRMGRRRPVSELRELVLYLSESVAPGEAGMRTATVAVADTEGAEPYPYVVGVREADGRRLAEGLAGRLRGGRRFPVREVELAPDALERVVESQSATPAATPWWFGAVWRRVGAAIGTIGLAAFGTALFSQPPPHTPWFLVLGAGAVLEFVLIRGVAAGPAPP